MTEEEKEFHKCKYCSTKMEWNEPHDTHGHVWFCEECEDTFCSRCIKEKEGINALEEYHYVEKILCVECLNKDR